MRSDKRQKFKVGDEVVTNDKVPKRWRNKRGKVTAFHIWGDRVSYHVEGEGGLRRTFYSYELDFASNGLKVAIEHAKKIKGKENETKI